MEISKKDLKQLKKDIKHIEKKINTKKNLTEDEIKTLVKYAKILFNNDKDKTKALEFYKLAADKGNTDAMYDYAEIIYRGEATGNDKNSALFYYSIVATSNREIDNDKKIKALHKCIEMLYKDENGNNKININKDQILKYYNELVGMDDIEGVYKYACILQENSIITNAEAMNYFKKAADEGHTEAMYKYACVLQDNDPFNTNTEAMNYFKKAADEGHIEAMYKYACILQENSIITNTEAMNYFKEAADKGHTEAMYKYACILQEDDGITNTEAMNYFKKAADEGHMEAMYKYACILQEDDGIANEEYNGIVNEEAMKYFKEAADKGHMEAMYEYACVLQDNDPFNINTEAMDYLKKAADKGQVKSMYKYACMVVQKNDGNTNAEAMRYFKKAANLGYKFESIGEGGENIVYKYINKSGELYTYKQPKEIDVKLEQNQVEIRKMVNILANLAGSGFTKEIGEEERGYAISKYRNLGDLNHFLGIKKNFFEFGIMVQLSGSLAKLHSMGIVHNDIKTDNVLLSYYNDYLKATICDFGYNCSIGKNGYVQRTFHYSAPEVFIAGKKITDKNDVYSMGITFIEIITRKKMPELFEELYNCSVNYSVYEVLARLGEETMDQEEARKNKIKGLIENSLADKKFNMGDISDDILDEIKPKIIELLIGMLEKDPNKRPSSAQVAERFGEITKILIDRGVEINNPKYCISQKNLYDIGIFTEENLEQRREKLEKDLNLLTSGEEPTLKKDREHLNTLTDGKKLSPQCKACFERLLSYSDRKGMNLSDDAEFKGNLEQIRESGNQREYLLVATRLLDLKELKMNYDIFKIKEKNNEIKKNKEDKKLSMQKFVHGTDKDKSEELNNLLNVVGDLSFLDKENHRSI